MTGDKLNVELKMNEHQPKPCQHFFSSYNYKYAFGDNRRQHPVAKLFLCQHCKAIKMLNLRNSELAILPAGADVLRNSVLGRWGIFQSHNTKETFASVTLVGAKSSLNDIEGAAKSWANKFRNAKILKGD